MNREYPLHPDQKAGRAEDRLDQFCDALIKAADATGGLRDLMVALEAALRAAGALGDSPVALPDPSGAPTPDADRLTLVNEAALILEQECWLVTRLAHEQPSRRLRDFAERYKAWQAAVDTFRHAHPQAWPAPRDNS